MIIGPSAISINRITAPQSRGESVSAVPHSKTTLRAASVTIHITRSTALSIDATSHLSAPSVLTDNVKIIRRASGPESVKTKDQPGALLLHDDGGLSDNDETKGVERDVAIKSPVKGKKRANNEVGYVS
jgi:hypothetical protein